MRKYASMNIIVHLPTTEQGKQELSNQITKIHANFVNNYIKNLNCSSEDKLYLLNAVIKDAKKREQTWCLFSFSYLFNYKIHLVIKYKIFNYHLNMT